MFKNIFEIKDSTFVASEKNKVVDFNLKIEKPGEIVCLLGPSGVGKTTIARIVAKSLNCIHGIEKIKWNSSFKDFKKYKYSNDLFETQEMHDLLLSFYKYGFVIIEDVPTEDNFLVKFANKVGSVRRTNFGEHFNVKSIPSPNDLAYTSLALAPHTDNPYRNPVPCIQLLHCIETVSYTHLTLPTSDLV